MGAEAAGELQLRGKYIVEMTQFELFEFEFGGSVGALTRPQKSGMVGQKWKRAILGEHSMKCVKIIFPISLGGSK